MNLREQIGQRLVTGFPGTEMSQEFKDVVREFKVGNVILFKRNIESKAQLKKLCADIQQYVKEQTGHPALITIDEEGGVVSRLSSDCVHFPGSMAIAATNNAENAYGAASFTAQQLKELGVNFNLAPCVDVNSNPLNPVIGVRSFSDDTAIVSKFGLSEIKAYTDNGVLSCVKHFPGHGDTSNDSHLTLPKVEKTVEQLREIEFKPFANAIKADVPAVMSSHILFPNIEKENKPATMSRVIMHDVLRGELGFKGLILSDCMEMNAIKDFYTTVGGVYSAMQAGVDLSFISHSTELCKDAVLRIEDGVAKGEISAQEMEQSAERIVKAKAVLCENMANTTSFDMQAAQKLSEKISAESICVINENSSDFDFAKAVYIGCVPYKTTDASEYSETDNLFGNIMAQKLGGKSLTMPSVIEQSDVENLVNKAKQHEFAVVGLFNAKMKQEQITLVEELLKQNVKIVCVCLRDPYDAMYLPENIPTYFAFEYTEQSVNAVADIFANKQKPSGIMPVKF